MIARSAVDAEEVRVAPDALHPSGVEDVAARPVDDGVEVLGGALEAGEHRAADEDPDDELEHQRQTHRPFQGRADGAHELAPRQGGADEQRLQGRDGEHQPRQRRHARPRRPCDRQRRPGDVGEHHPGQAPPVDERPQGRPQHDREDAARDRHSARHDGAERVHPGDAGQCEEQDEDAPRAQQEVAGRLSDRRCRRSRHGVLGEDRHRAHRLSRANERNPVRRARIVTRRRRVMKVQLWDEALISAT